MAGSENVDDALTGRSNRSIRVDEIVTAAAKLLVKEQLCLAEFACGSVWLRDLDLSWRLEHSSRPLHASSARLCTDVAGLGNLGNSCWLNATVVNRMQPSPEPSTAEESRAIPVTSTTECAAEKARTLPPQRGA